MMVVVVASNLMRRVFVLFNNVRVACSVVGNPMICGSNAGAGECAAALPPVTVPFPLESTPGGSSEHSSFLPLCLSFISTASQAGQLARLVALNAFRPFLGVRGVACMHASLLPLLLCPCLAGVAVEGTRTHGAVGMGAPSLAAGNTCSRLYVALVARSGLNRASAAALAWGSAFGFCVCARAQGQGQGRRQRAGQRLLARGCRSA